jgi:glycosyltransferase involved in cell wall biosynthesis
MHTPRVTVLMPVYNGERYVHEAISSILNQTFQDFELLIVNDGSTDNSINIIDSFNDKRIRVIHNEANIKLIATLNKGLSLAKGQYIARMDCDDISLPKRLEKQFIFMESNPDVAMVGSWIKVVNEYGGLTRSIKYLTPAEYISSVLLFANCFAHPSIFIRSSSLQENRYLDSFLHAEDYDLWVRLASCYKVSNLQQFLVKYREHAAGITSKKSEIVFQTTQKIMRYQLNFLGIQATDNEIDLHYKIGQLNVESTPGSLQAAERWLIKLLTANRKMRYYPNTSFEYVIAHRWLGLCSRATSINTKSWELFWHSELSQLIELGDSDKVKFAIKCLANPTIAQLKKR